MSGTPPEPRRAAPGGRGDGRRPLPAVCRRPLAGPPADGRGPENVRTPLPPPSVTYRGGGSDAGPGSVPRSSLTVIPSGRARKTAPAGRTGILTRPSRSDQDIRTERFDLRACAAAPAAARRARPGPRAAGWPCPPVAGQPPESRGEAAGSRRCRRPAWYADRTRAAPGSGAAGPRRPGPQGWAAAVPVGVRGGLPPRAGPAARTCRNRGRSRGRKARAEADSVAAAPAPGAVRERIGAAHPWCVSACRAAPR